MQVGEWSYESINGHSGVLGHFSNQIGAQCWVLGIHQYAENLSRFEHFHYKTILKQ